MDNFNDHIWSAQGLGSYLEDITGDMLDECINDNDNFPKSEAFLHVISASLIGIFRKLEIITEDIKNR